MDKGVQRKILPLSDDFRKFWHREGPFRYALTSREFPSVLLELEEWIFSDDMAALLKALMQWDEREMKLVQAPFNRNKTNILKPESLTPWRIVNFPAEWESTVCSLFTPSGYLTDMVTSSMASEKIEDIENAFFTKLAQEINNMGYVLLLPEPLLSPDTAYVDEYLKEWAEDEAEI